MGIRLFQFRGPPLPPTLWNLAGLKVLRYCSRAMPFSEPKKAIPKRWMHFRTANIYFEVWETRHTGCRPFAIEVGLFLVPKASNTRPICDLDKHERLEVAFVESAVDRNVLLSSHKCVQRTF